MRPAGCPGKDTILSILDQSLLPGSVQGIRRWTSKGVPGDPHIMSDFDIIGLVWLVGALILVGPSAVRVVRGNPNALTYVALWLGIALALGLGYRFFGP